jgi:polyisoprenoid-binding protein YceI
MNTGSTGGIFMFQPSSPFLIVAMAATLSSGGMLGCSKDPAKDKPAAEVSQATNVAASSEAQAEQAAEKLSLSADSKIEFVGSKVTGSHEGSFKKFEGSVELRGDDLEKAAVTVSIDMASLESEPEKLVGHLKSPDFFAVEKHPKAVFTSTSIKKGAEGGATHTVVGNLELRGVKKSVTFPATITLDKSSARAKAEFSINRKEWGIVYDGKADDLIREDVVIKLDLNAKRGS